MKTQKAHTVPLFGDIGRYAEARQLLNTDPGGAHKFRRRVVGGTKSHENDIISHIQINVIGRDTRLYFKYRLQGSSDTRTERGCTGTSTHPWGIRTDPAHAKAVESKTPSG